MAFKSSHASTATIALYRAAAWAGHRLAPAAGRRRRSLEAWRAWAASPTYAPPIWVHAASVGEALAAQPVWGRLRAARPTTPIVLTYTSPSSRQWPSGWPVDHADFLPPDQPGPIAAMLDALRPRLLVFSRADLWPELVGAALARDIPVALISAAVRRGSGRLRWPVRRLFQSLYHGLAYVGAVSSWDGARLLSLGVRPEVLEVTGDPRHDQVLERQPAWKAVQPLAPWAAQGSVLVAGSTDPRDERLLLSAMAALERRSAARLLLCPHQPSPQRTKQIVSRAQRLRIQAVPWRGQRVDGDASCVIVERVGILADLYLWGALAYVGGGLGSRGVHAVTEPAAYALPVIVGPRGHSADVARLLEAGGAAALPPGNQVEAMAALWDTWLRDGPGRQRAGLAARRALEAGTARRTAARLLDLMADD